ncbi:hypothetical protein SAMN05216226_110133 [Halovenus aranensis]|jgi:hypothetical protein|uniref:Uncharacterized protein n=1 Tax=Halovenus aranensis TaxID=890420 RepID=A0A1G8X6T3_9EURY|nr:hypothetical protein [Halovenus aranensis]SDJ86124.1 hypothetical protein SAMN05216226_110133 [Halovenus aranensis]
MVYRWRCRHCEFTVWGRSGEAVANQVRSHMLAHNRQHVTEGEMQVQWTCPYCDRTGQTSGRERGLEAYSDHLFGHVEALMESGVHVADDIGHTGSILTLSPLESAGANNARVHFISPCDIAVFVTTNPSRRIRLLKRELTELPAWIVVLTTKREPLESLSEESLSTLPLEVVRLDKQLGLSDLGQTVSRVLGEQERMDGKITVEFDILSELLDTFTLQNVFKFLHILNSRLEKADALSHYYFDPSAGYEGSANVIEEMFDLRIRANEETFVSEPSTSP